jgi:hypothetical protein
MESMPREMRVSEVVKYPTTCTTRSVPVYVTRHGRCPNPLLYAPAAPLAAHTIHWIPLAEFYHPRLWIPLDPVRATKTAAAAVTAPPRKRAKTAPRRNPPRAARS